MDRSAIIGKLLSFLDASPSPFHAVDVLKRQLLAGGFLPLCESSSWSGKLAAGGKYFFTRNGSALVAFTLGGQFSAAKSAAHIVAAHTDSPCLKVKPVSKRSTKDGILQVAVETYGGGLWHTWFDRDLGIAGRMTTMSKDDCQLHEHLIMVDRPVLRLSTLAIHLDSSVRESFKFNTEVQLTPILATESIDAMAKVDDAEKDLASEGHHPALVRLIKMQCAAAGAFDVVSMDINLFDVQKAALGGVHEEFIFSARLDDLMLAFCAIESLLGAQETNYSDTNVRMAVLFDNEEVGSESAHGAMSTLLQGSLERILAAFGKPENLHEFLARSFLVSADMAHAAHPNYSDKHDEAHRPQMHKGVVIKFNSNQRYATTSRTAAIIKALGARLNVPLQQYMVRNDSPCGTTVGSILAAKLGIQTVDIGLPQLSMHSIREIAGVGDVELGIRLLKGVFEMGCQGDPLVIHTLDGIINP